MIDDAALLTAGTEAGGRLGASIAVSPDGSRAAAGRPGDGGPTPLVGAVLTYTFDAAAEVWVEDPGVLNDQSPQIGDEFGAAVAVSGEYMAIGAPGRLTGVNAEAGSVSIFQWNDASTPPGWDFVQRITRPSGSQALARFGTSVDLQHEPGVGWTLIAGAPGVTGALGTGEVSIFESDDGQSWTPASTLTSFFSEAFGAAVAISGPYAIVGDPGFNVDQGRVVIHERTGGAWSTSPAATFNGTDLGDRAGLSVDIDAGTAVYGLPEAAACCIDDPPFCSFPPSRGEVRILERIDGTWQSTSALRSSNCGVGLEFGASLWIGGEQIAVGAPAGGLVTLYARASATTWYAAAELSAVEPPVAGFGGAVAVAPEGRGVLGGWASDSAVLLAAGSIREWMSPDDCDGNGLPDDCEIQNGPPSLDCDGNGVLDACEIPADPEGLDCNDNGILDHCEIAELGAFVDLDANGILDECEILDGLYEDCNQNLVPDAFELRTVEIVWLIDTSLSQTDKFDDVCDLVNGVEADLDPGTQDVYLRSRVLTIGSLSPGPFCGRDDVISVQELFGDDLSGLGMPASVPPTTDESWSAFTALVADRNDWRTSLRVIVPISDECGWNDPATCDGADMAAITAAVEVLRCRDVLAFPVQFEEDSGWLSDVLAEMRRLAGEFRDSPPPPDPILGTGGRAFTLEVEGGLDLVITELAEEIRRSLPIHDNDGDLVLDACELAGDAPDPALQDCNLNWIDDAFEIRADIGMSRASLAIPSLPEECDVPCLGDVDGDRRVTFQEDLVPLLAAWGPCGSGDCPTDLDGDGQTGLDDLLAVLNNWDWCFDPPPCRSSSRSKLLPPQSITDCLQKYGADPVKLQQCIEAMILADTP